MLSNIDSGACRSLSSVCMAQRLSLPIQWASGGNCGTFSVPGAMQLQQYAGVVPSVRVKFAEGVEFELRGLRVVHHPHSMLLVGCDVLRGGRPAGQANFEGIIYETRGPGQVQGWLQFGLGGRSVRCPSVNVPSEGVTPFAFNPTAAPPPVVA